MLNGINIKLEILVEWRTLYIYEVCMSCYIHIVDMNIAPAMLTLKCLRNYYRCSRSKVNSRRVLFRDSSYVEKCLTWVSICLIFTKEPCITGLETLIEWVSVYIDRIFFFVCGWHLHGMAQIIWKGIIKAERIREKNIWYVYVNGNDNRYSV